MVMQLQLYMLGYLEDVTKNTPFPEGYYFDKYLTTSEFFVRAKESDFGCRTEFHYHAACLILMLYK